MIDYQIRLVPFPTGKVQEAVTENTDGSYTIFVNKNLASIEQRRRCLHALKHIVGQDFEKYVADEVEQAAHRQIGEERRISCY